MAPISWLSFTVPKAGYTDSENEDSVFPSSGFGQNGRENTSQFLVADGATQTSFSNLWAKCLIESCSRTHLSEVSFLRAVKSAQMEWNKNLEGVELPWHAQEKLRQGAFSALTWLEIQYFPLQPTYSFTWRALAVGDCCLFIARNRMIYLSLPLQKHTDFTNTPVLIPSKSEKLNSISGKIQTARGSLKMGDQLILASDAFSSWIMKKAQTDHGEILNKAISIKKTKNSRGFSDWVNALRSKNEIKNDDTSLIFIELGEVD